jgi:putative N6-adenine-specific DNA methylase
VATDLTTRQLYVANRSLRCATRVLVRVAGFTARSFADLERRLGEVDWASWLVEDARPSYRITSRGSQLVHTGAIGERFAAALGAGRPDGPEQIVVVRVSRDRFTISVDSSGAPLHMRGWRQATAKAPLRESVAAGMLLAADGTRPRHWSIRCVVRGPSPSRRHCSPPVGLLALIVPSRSSIGRRLSRAPGPARRRPR